MEANRLQTVLNEGTGINREELNQEIEISKIREQCKRKIDMMSE